MTTKENHHHRSSLKQKNKPFKGAAARSKSRGRVEGRSTAAASKPGKTLNAAAMSKADRRNHAKILQASKRAELRQEKRIFAGRAGAARTVAFVPLTPSVDLSALLDTLKAGSVDGETLYVEEHRQNLRWLLAPFNDWSVMGRISVSDLVVFVVHTRDSSDLEVRAYELLSVIRAQGVSSALAYIQQDDMDAPLSKDAKSEWTDRLTTELPSITRLFLAAPRESRETAEFIRLLCSQRLAGISWRERRPYMLSDSAVLYDAERGQVHITGFARGGQPFSANRLVHLPGHGTFALDRINLSSSQGGGSGEMMAVDKMEQSRDDAICEPLRPTDGNMDMDEEADEAHDQLDRMISHDASMRKKRVVRVPKGTSSYQAAWLGEAVEEEIDGSEDEKEEVQLTSEDEDEDQEEEEEVMDDPYEREAHRLDPDSRLLRTFPDRIAIPSGTSARSHLAQYRGLQSLRTAAWDPEEGLPAEYGQIYQFKDVARSVQRAVNGPVESPFSPGQRLTLVLADVSAEAAAALCAAPALPIYGLLPHEQRTSVVHFTVLPRSHTLQSNERVVVWMGGIRRFVCQPIYSEHSSSALHKMLRTVEPGVTAVASIYAPIHYAPGPVLLFNEAGALLSLGQVLGPEPRRIVLQRSTLTGASYKVHRRSAVVRWMFESAADVAWFKPVELCTRSGRRGHIKASVGTHGHFKALFDKPLISNEPIGMHLYRRIFPAWDTTHPI